MTAVHPLTIRQLGLRDYEPVWRDMQDFTDRRTPDTADEIWFVEHPSVYTLGLAGKREHLLAPGEIPVVACDRGGQVTYHGPGQLIAYVLINLKRRDFGVRRLVSLLEQSVVDLLAEFDIAAAAKPEAPGVYVDEKKIASLGLRVRRGCSYHGLSLNVDMDVEPFQRINPCGYPGLEVTQLKNLGVDIGMGELSKRLLVHLNAQLAGNSNRSIR
ncbi:octanoyltransferase [Alkalilimnicola ehrlichii]|uniref:lipoyl(octanoyl) transferase LipB n=1 Tax=Alkalilimnicola ehrlichii TaxID=351052 RepID=UPI000E2F5EB7|nr:lipoyl(octanoyl) transferase LipB [Alkalilimnicola ehrlichii]RFA31278.1 octanoyltransferase [Alkalilimnicola ehrlichii]